MKRARCFEHKHALCLAAALLLGGTSAAHAETLAAPALARPAPPTRAAASARPVPAERAEQAKQLYALGAEAFAARQNSEAIRYFRRAAAIVPSAKLTYNIALAYEELGEAGRALTEYRAYLRQEHAAEPDPEVLARMRKLEQQLAAHGVQQLIVLSRPPGATVRVGEQAVGVTPWSGELAPGSYQVNVDLPGHAPRRAEVALSPDQATEVELELSPRPPVKPAAPDILEPRHVTPLAWTFLGVGVGAIAGGVAFELSRATSSDRAGSASSELGAAEARGAADAKQMTSLVLLGFGSGFLIGGGVLVALDLTRQAPRKKPSTQSASARLHTSIGLPCTPGFCGVVSQGSF
jgi:tetratricopeptide (TPR) repeat protein